MVDYQKMSYSNLVPEHIRGKRFATVVWTLCVCDESTRRQLEQEYSAESRSASAPPPNR
jgi:hypothetical protein